MSISGTGASSSSLMSWLITHNNELNNSLDEAMHQGDVNVATQKELKQLLDHMKDSTQYGYKQIQIDMNAFLAKHADDPECGNLNSVIKKMADAYGKAQDSFNQDKPEEASTTVSSCPEQLQTELDAMKKMDELQMVRINDLSSQRSQSFQLVSNMMASGNQVLGGMINNIKG